MAELKKAFWLDESGEDVHIPVGGGEFSPSGFIGPLMAQVFYTFYSEEDLAGLEGAPKFTARRKFTNGWSYYFSDQALALEATKLIGAYPPQQQWTFQMQTSEVLNTNDKAKLAESFGDSITIGTTMATYMSKKRRHEFHLITLPSVVAAMAAWYGVEVPKFDVSPIVGKVIRDESEKDSEFKGKYIVVNDEFQNKMIGNGDEKDMKKIMAETFFGQQRTEIWKALGEDDPLKYTVGMDGKWDTGAENLAACLKAVVKPWSKAIYARLVMVSDPRVDAGREKDGVWKHNSLPVVLDIWDNKAAAEVAAKEDLARFEKGGNGIGKPALPEVWKELGEAEFLKNIADLKGLSKPAMAQKMKKTDYGATVEQVEEWLTFVK